MNKLNYIIKLVLITAVLSLLVMASTQNNAYAASIRKVRKSKVIIKLSRKDKFKVGDTYAIYTKKGKLKGKLKITKIRKRKAWGRVTKGKARRSYYVRAEKSKFASILDGGKNIYAGGLFGMSMDSMSAEGRPEKPEGNGVSIKGFYDYPLFNFMWVRASAGLQNFKGDCSITNCSVNINYLSFDGYARFVFNKRSKIRAWAGGFVSGMFPLSTDSTFVENEKVGSTTLFGGAGGIDYILNRKFMIPIMIEYGMFPSGSGNGNAEITANSINIRAGIGYRW